MRFKLRLHNRWFQRLIFIALPLALFWKTADILSWRPRTLGHHSAPVLALAFSPNGETLASASGDTTVFRKPGELWLWDVRARKVRHKLAGHQDAVNAVVFSPDGKLLTSACYDSTVRLWDAATGTLVRTLAGHGKVSGLTFSPDGRTLAGGSMTVVKLWDAATGKPLRRIAGHGGWVSAVAFSPDGKLLASGSDDGTLKLWDASTGRLQRVVTKEHDQIKSVAFWPTEQTVAVGRSSMAGDAIYLYETATGELNRIRGTQKGSTNIKVAFSPDGWTAATMHVGTNMVRLYDMRIVPDQRYLLRVIGPTEGVKATMDSIAFSPDGKTLATGDYDGTVRLWRIK